MSQNEIEPTKEFDDKTKELVGKSLNAEELREELNNTSPLQMSKKLIDIELHDQQDSLEIMDKIYEEFESGQDIVNSLVNPMLLGITDGLLKHDKFKGSFRKTNITPSRLVNEVNAFSYNHHTKKEIDDDVFLTQAEKTYYNNEKLGVDKNGKNYSKDFHRKKHYDTKSRSTTEKEKGINRNETIMYENKNGEIKTKQTATITDDITGEKLDLTIDGARQKGMQAADMDHVNPINNIRNKYKNNPYLYRDDLEHIIGLTENETYINSSLNRAKGDMTWSEFIKKNPDALTEEQKDKALKLEKEANEAQSEEAKRLMVKNIALKGLGDAIVLILKPIWFEIKDMFKNGILHGFDTNDKIEAFILRLKRVGKFIKENALQTLGDAIKDIIGNFIPMLISSIAKIFTGIFEKIIQIISDGFMAIKEAFKVMMKPDNEVSKAQKADAIMKIIVGAVVPILVFAFEESIFGYFEGTPFDFLKDVASIILSGLASTLVIWLLDQIDLFSVKDEKRLARVKEIFQLRIENIKKNTDIFEKVSLEVLAKQKLQFKKVVENMNHAIDNNLDVNDSVYQMADFMQINLKVKSTDDFLYLLNTNDKLTI